MRTRRISYHRKFSAELVFSSDRGRTSPTENCHFNLHDVQWQFTAARINQDRSARETLRRIRRSTAITAGKFSQMPVTNLMSVNLSLRATALAVAAIVFLVPMVAQAGSRPCTGAHCKPVKPVVTKIEKPTVSGL